MNKNNIESELVKTTIYESFSPDVKRALLTKGKIKKFNKNQIVYNKGDLCNSFDIVIEGILVSYSLNAKENENVMFNFTPNTFMGGNLLFANKPIYPMSIYSQEDCTIYCLSKRDVEELISYKEFALFFIISISKNAQNLNKKIVKYTQNTLRDNIIEYLQELRVIQRSDKIILPISKKELAIVFGVQRQSLFRELKRMRDDGIIDYDNKMIVYNQ